uniref:Putative secreted peptide n=1 Tax=Anopheles braziliensis TaxID=58242 RepID=A0A2M3ZEC0_9DIPT
MESGSATLPRMSVLSLLPLLLCVMLLMSSMGSVGEVAAFPVPSEVTTYSSVADLGTLAQGAAGIASQMWNTGARLGNEFFRRGFAVLGLA